jgi:hypothetical protein
VLLGRILLDEGSATEAEALLAPAYRARRERFGTDDERTRKVAGLLATCLRRLGRGTEADALRD